MSTIVIDKSYTKKEHDYVIASTVRVIVTYSLVSLLLLEHIHVTKYFAR